MKRVRLSSSSSSSASESDSYTNRYSESSDSDSVSDDSYDDAGSSMSGRSSNASAICFQRRLKTSRAAAMDFNKHPKLQVPGVKPDSARIPIQRDLEP